MTTRRDFLSAMAAGLACPLVADLAAAADRQEMPMTPTGSDLGSLFPVIRAQTQRGEFPLSFLQPSQVSLTAWQQQARAKVLDLAHYAPPHCDPRPEVTARIERDGYLEEQLTFNTTPDIRVPARVLIPKRAKFPAPGIVALHDHGAFFLWGKEKLLESPDEHPALTEFKRTAYGGVSIASALARQGYVVIVIDMFYWGERRLLLDADPADWRERSAALTAERVLAYNQRSSQYTDLVARSIYSTGTTWYGLMVHDDLRTLDYLASRPEVDPQRLGCVGLSVGGFRSGQLAALDSRIRAAVAVGWMCSFPPQLPTQVKNTFGYMMLVPGLYQHLDYPDVVSLAMPGALMVINGSKDGLFHYEGVKHCFDKLERCWAKAGYPEKINCRWYDGPHEFNRPMQAEAWDWLKRWL